MDTQAARLLQLMERLRMQGRSPAFARLSALNLSFSQVRVVRLLVDHPVLSMKELAELLDLTPPSVTALIRRLGQVGLVERRPHPADSRVVLLALTQAGHELHQVLYHEQLERMAQLLAGLSIAEQEQFLALLERAVRALGETPPENC